MEFALISIPKSHFLPLACHICCQRFTAALLNWKYTFLLSAYSPASGVLTITKSLFGTNHSGWPLTLSFKQVNGSTKVLSCWSSNNLLEQSAVLALTMFSHKKSVAKFRGFQGDLLEELWCHFAVTNSQMNASWTCRSDTRKLFLSLHQAWWSSWRTHWIAEKSH